MPPLNRIATSQHFPLDFRAIVVIAAILNIGPGSVPFKRLVKLPQMHVVPRFFSYHGWILELWQFFLSWNASKKRLKILTNEDFIRYSKHGTTTMAIPMKRSRSFAFIIAQIVSINLFEKKSSVTLRFSFAVCWRQRGGRKRAKIQNKLWRNFFSVVILIFATIFDMKKWACGSKLRLILKQYFLKL